MTPELKLYSIVCTPVGVYGPLLLELTVLVAAARSADATKKVVKRFQELYPLDDIKSVEIREFRVIAVPEKTLVVV